jgi:hypothetical protein
MALWPRASASELVRLKTFFIPILPKETVIGRETILVEPPELKLPIKLDRL